MSVGYRVFGFCDDCLTDMPTGIRHNDVSQFYGLTGNLRAIAAEKHGWIVDQSGDRDYCPACAKKRKAAEAKLEDRR